MEPNPGRSDPTRAFLQRQHQQHRHFFFNDTATTEIYTLSLHDALPITCSSDCSSVPNRFCTLPAGACAALLLVESSGDPTCEPFLWPCVWILRVGSAEDADVKFGINDI